MNKFMKYKLNRDIPTSILHEYYSSQVYESGIDAHIINEGYIPIMDFYIIYNIGHPSSISKAFNQDDEFHAECGKKIDGKWYIQPNKAIHWLANERHHFRNLKRKAQSFILQHSL